VDRVAIRAPLAPDRAIAWAVGRVNIIEPDVPGAPSDFGVGIGVALTTGNDESWGKCRSRSTLG